MDNSNSTNNPLVAFFTLTFLLSLPFYVLNLLAYLNIAGKSEMGPLYIVLFTITPIASASILSYQNSGIQGLKSLLARIFDFRRIQNHRWYVAIIFLSPLLFLVALGILVLLDMPVPPAMAPLVALPLILLFFFLLATGEEVGWMGYAFESMQARFGALGSALVLGMIWALWHVPFLVFMIPDLIALSAQLLTIVAARVLIVWIYNNAGKSVFAAILFHALDNTALVTFPEIKTAYPWGAVVFCLLVIITAFVVVLLWGPKTLAKYKCSDECIKVK
ncbi:MAG: CPBP family intramembrane glutamic endopeptidase [Candidatus Thiodiazotropha sp.]